MILCKCGCGEILKNIKSKTLTNRGHHLRLQEIKEKRKQTCIAKYGTENPISLKEIQEKSKQTCKERYGVEHPYQSKEIQKKGEESTLKKFGVTNIFKDKEKIKNCYQEKLGIDNPSKLQCVKEKKKQTYQNNYGTDHWAKSLEGRKALRINSIKDVEVRILNNEPLMPNIGKLERLCLDELQKYTQYDIIRNDTSFSHIIGRFPDGHILELKLFIQFDERFHFEDKEMTIYKQDDITCTCQLESLGYNVFRVSEKKWIDNKELIINQFKELLTLMENKSCRFTQAVIPMEIIN